MIPIVEQEHFYLRVSVLYSWPGLRVLSTPGLSRIESAIYTCSELKRLQFRQRVDRWRYNR